MLYISRGHAFFNMRIGFLAIVLLTNLVSAHGQCTIGTAESQDKKVLFQKTWGAEIKRGKKIIQINIVRVDTVEFKDKPTFYLTIAVDSLNNEVANAADQLTLIFEKQKQANLESKEITLPEFAFIFNKNERFFPIETMTLDKITRNLLKGIEINEEKKKAIVVYTVDKQFAHQAQCIKNAW
jgi:hypothetical protein